ncbi:MAG: CoA transferase [Chloroflexi bacterium]|nr:CoA transferase [Chloroflexota bacterium]MCH8892417.1 CoA transferase [Chloroflexota bacterium]MCH9016145.1 CoA transferase [Chloroflexota bacterium]MCI0800728.1 CoA transferase [Chloroflexota bacterium]MCI0810170.1 CoA transferase [Chloroflexota bacterium]
MPAGLLNGIRVLDLGSGISGPWCAKILADYGAEVIKVESPGSGDAARRMGPFAGDDPDPEKSLTFLYLNTNKKGVTLDPSSASGRRLLDRLLAEADVLVENYPPARSKELGLDYASLAEVNPQVVVTSITPFGQTGPYRDYQATDIVTYALSGLMYHSGDSDQEPLRNVLDQSFYVAGITAAAATQVALFARLTSGEGQHVDVSAAECLGAHLVQPLPYYNYMGAVKGRRPVRGAGFEELMPARDGYVAPSVQGSQPWSTIASLIGPEELQDEKFATAAGRVAHGEELKELLIKGLAQWDRMPLFLASGEQRLVFGMAQDAGDLAHCPHLEARDFFVEVDHPVVGRARYPGMAVRLPGETITGSQPAPLLGQHNSEIFGRELGYSTQDLVSLRQQGVI